MPGTLIVFYSRTGSTKILAEGIRTRIACDIDEIQPQKGYRGIWGFIKGGYQAKSRSMPKIKPANNDPAPYDLVVLGTPVWAGRMASPMRTYINNNKAKFRKVAFFCTCGDTGDSTFVDLKETVGLDPISTLALKNEEIKGGDFSGSIEKFVGGLKT